MILVTSVALHEFRGMILTSFSTHCYAQAHVQPLQWVPPQLDAHLTPPLKGKPAPGREDENAFVELFAVLDTVVQDTQDNDQLQSLTNRSNHNPSALRTMTTRLPPRQQRIPMTMV